MEKDVVLVIARTLRGELERQGYQVALTREGNENPSFDDRAALANAQRGTVFITLHVSSTGRPGMARTYYFSGTRLDSTEPPASLQRSGPLPWEQAQLAYAAASRRFADLIQVQLGQKFRGSPELPAPAVLRQLRSVAAPAVAVEISSVAVPDAKNLTGMAPDLAAAIVRALEAYRPLYEAGGAR
jgi:N-acetylmuramoyl-L-alanine amidase